MQSKIKVFQHFPGVKGRRWSEEAETEYIAGGIPASSGSFCSSLLALRGKEEVLNLFSLFRAECDPGCFTLIR